ncbi:GtrA family protein [Paenibacillus sp. M1]|uniref:GtrA family protein n=1 Tax=Paenibacillus haidiansis TaxID=1574488 RepID=A0ABU7VQP4_9BACL
MQVKRSAVHRFKPSLLQFAKFNMVGVINTAIDFACFALLTEWGAEHGIAQIFSYSAGMVNSFLMNRRYTFDDRRMANTNRRGPDAKRFIRFVALNLIVLALSLVLLRLMSFFPEVHVLLAKAGVTFVTVILNFYGSRKWVFRRNLDTVENSLPSSTED